jgi:3-oxoacyl-[acyl-carrier protein] reductase
MKTALITGGTKGIGLAVADRLCKEEWNVILTYLADESNATAMVSQLNDKYPNSQITLLCADCSNIETINLVDTILIKKNIKLDAVVFNAGTTNRATFEDINILDWQHVFDVNINFPTFLLQKIASRLNDRSSIVFTGSLMGIQPHSLSLSYGVSKAAVHALVKNLVKVFAPRKIRVNAIAPGFINTEWQKAKPIEIKENINRKIALGRFCEPSELADTYWLLINNSYMNGEIIVVDGGYGME